MIYRKLEGLSIRNGFNWNRDENTFFQFHIRLGLIVFGLRIRSKELLQRSEVKKKKYLPYFAIRAYKKGYILNENFDTMTIKFGNKKVTYELVGDFIDSLEKEGN